MPDLIPKLLPELKKHQFSGLKLPDGLIAPKYDGDSILNIPASICHWMNIPGIGEGPLNPQILAPIGDSVRRVILILMDALAMHRLQAWMDDGTAPIWQDLLEDGVLAPLTSISPSTTSAALTTFWTGQSPSAHGILGYEVWLKEYSMVTNMILHAPMTFRGDVGGLRRAGFDPEKFLPVPTLGPHLRRNGVIPYAFQHHNIAHSGLSRMFQREVEISPFGTAADLWVSLRQMIESQPDERIFAWTYWGEVDGLSHYFSPDEERVLAEFSHFSAAFEQFFIQKLSPKLRKDTLVILTADHGQVHTPLNPVNALKHHPDLMQQLHITPTGENRMAYFHLKPDSEAFVRDYVETHWPEQFLIFSKEQALEAGLFGPSPNHPGLRDRVGDLILIARGDNYLWWANKVDFMLGRHGGLHREEMLVPFLAARL